MGRRCLVRAAAHVPSPGVWFGCVVLPHPLRGLHRLQEPNPSVVCVHETLVDVGGDRGGPRACCCPAQTCWYYLVHRLQAAQGSVVLAWQFCLRGCRQPACVGIHQRAGRPADVGLPGVLVQQPETLQFQTTVGLVKGPFVVSCCCWKGCPVWCWQGVFVLRVV
jgi:hypothetical protein